jgi:hypothetical protein
MADHQFEKKVSRQMDGFELKPSADVWQQVEAQLREDRRRRRWLFLLFPLGLLLLGGLTYGLWPSSKKITASSNTVRTNSLNEKESTPNNAFVEPQKNETPVAVTDSKTISPPSDNPSEIPLPEKSKDQADRIANVDKKRTDVATNTAIEVYKKPEKSNAQTNPKTNPKTKSKTTGISTKIAKHNTTMVAQVQSNQHVEAEHVETSSVNQTLVNTEPQKQDSVAKVEQPLLTDSSVTVEEVKLTATDTVVSSESLNKPVVSPDKKWQLGLHSNAGIADIRETFFPGTGFRAESTSYFGNTGTLGGAPINGASRVVVYEYAIEPSLQYGAGLVLRRKFANRHAFVTGLLYQYNSYAVTQRTRIDTFISSANSFMNVSTKDVKASFRIHTINVPLEWELPLAKAGKGSFRLGGGVHNWFSFSSTQTKSFSNFRYDRSGTGGGLGSKPAVTQYQPVLHLAPIYEWRGKKQTFQAALFFNYGLRPVYQASEKDYWWQTGIRFRIYFNK